MSKGPAKPHKDKFGQELAIGDVVVCMRKRYRDLVWATIIGVTPLYVRVSYERYSGTSNEEYLTPPDDTIRAPEHKQIQNKLGE